MWLLYGLFAIKWHTMGDFGYLREGRIGDIAVRWPRPSSRVVEGMVGAGPTEWARHQVDTTVDFAPRNRLLSSYLGGLIFQVEHHLFSRVCHIHYPAIAEVVREVCEAHGVRHRSYPGLRPALASHARWLREMGAEPARAPEGAAGGEIPEGSAV